MKRAAKRKLNKTSRADAVRSGISLTAAIKINGQLLFAFLLGGASWWLWPSSPKWWGLGMVSIVLGAGSLGKLIEALRSMGKIYAREKELSRLAATARSPVQSDLANDSAMEDAGMFDD